MELICNQIDLLVNFIISKPKVNINKSVLILSLGLKKIHCSFRLGFEFFGLLLSKLPNIISIIYP